MHINMYITSDKMQRKLVKITNVLQRVGRWGGGGGNSLIKMYFWSPTPSF